MDIFTDEEMLVIYESARIAWADADVFDAIAENLDVSDEWLVKLREKLQNYMDN